jgi:hypothetical protein
MLNSNPCFQTTICTVDIMNLCKVLIWPLLAFIVFLFIRKPIIGLINRITKIGLSGTSVEAHQQQAVEKQVQKNFSTVDQTLGVFRKETIEMVAEVVRKETDIESLLTDQLKIERLTNYSVALYIIKNFESIYNLIFGSQILILQQLNTFAHEDFDSLKRYFDYGVKQNPNFFENYEYSDYIGFLFAINFIVYEGKQIKITNLGVDFLKYLTENSRNIYKLN